MIIILRRSTTTGLLLLSTWVLAEVNLPATCSAANPLIREQYNTKVEEFNQMMSKSAEIESKNPSQNEFSCAGIGVIDYHSAMDGELYFYNTSSRKLISICGMGLYISAIPNKQMKCSEICPPLGWRANGCDEKYTKYIKSQ